MNEAKLELSKEDVLGIIIKTLSGHEDLHPVHQSLLIAELETSLLNCLIDKMEAKLNEPTA